MTQTLTEFLLARIAEDEARVAGFWQGEDPDFFWGPDRIRSECQVHRRIVERVYEEHGLRGELLDGILHDLAAVYADHPDYRQEWRP